MPNYCENIMDFYHKDIHEVDKMKKLIEDTGVLLSNYMPEPKQYAEGSKEFWNCSPPHIPKHRYIFLQLHNP